MTGEEKRVLFDQLVAKGRRFNRKGKTLPYTSANGYMFSQLNHKGELGIRFSKAIQKKYREELNTITYKSFGATMKGYILMPENMWNDLDTLAKYLDERYD